MGKRLRSARAWLLPTTLVPRTTPDHRFAVPHASGGAVQGGGWARVVRAKSHTMRWGQLCGLCEALVRPPSQTPSASHLRNLSVLRNPASFPRRGPWGPTWGVPRKLKQRLARVTVPRVESDCDVQVTGASPNATEQVQEASAKKPKCCDGLPGICEHGRQRSRCKECDGSGVCEHRRLRHSCKQCGGSGICEHGRRKSDCKQCQGSSICEHGRQKRQCRECLAVYGACVHGKARNGYMQCGNRRFASQNARETLNHDLSNKNLTQQHKIAHDISAAISAPHSGDVAQLSGILQRNIALPMYGLPQTALVSMNPLLMMPMLPAHLALQPRHEPPDDAGQPRRRQLCSATQLATRPTLAAAAIL